MTEQKVRRLMHLMLTLQIVNDETEGLPAELDQTPYKREVKQEAKRLLQSIRNFLRVLDKPNETLVAIWNAVPSEEMDDLITAKRRLVLRMQNANFEEISEMDMCLEFAERKTDMLVIIEEILEKHTIKEVRDMYRARMVYTKEQFLTLLQTSK